MSKDGNAKVDIEVPTQTRVLLAEDDESFIDALVIGLAREGFDVTVATDGTEALRLFDEVDARQAGQHQVEQDQVGFDLAKETECFGAVGGHRHVEAFAGQSDDQSLDERLVVLS